MKVAIHHDGKEGFVSYNPGNHEIMVTHPDEKVRNTVRHYLTNDRDFVISGSHSLDQVGNRLIITSKPNANVQHMCMGLSEMFHHTGVHTNWDHKDNNLDDLTRLFKMDEPDPNAGADKPITKSIFGDDEYEIIN